MYYQERNGPQHEKTCLHGFANKKGTDQSAHPRRLNSDFVFRFFKSKIYRLATSENLHFHLVSVAVETGLGLAFSETMKTGIVALRPISDMVYLGVFCTTVRI